MRESMEIYPRTAAERAMKLHEVLLTSHNGEDQVVAGSGVDRASASGRCVAGGSGLRSKALRDYWTGGERTPSQQARAEGAGRRGSEPVPGQVLRSERAALSREAAARNIRSG